MPARKLRVVIAGQLPPPVGGQNIMIEKALAQFRRFPQCQTEHLPFFFTPHVQTARRGDAGKLFELVRVVGRLLRLRARGKIDVLLYPAGGPQSVPLLRDLLLLPWMVLFSSRVVIQFHAAGIGDEIAKGKFLARLVASLYRKAFAAIVNSDFNRRDPESVGINRTILIPCHIVDEFDPQLLHRGNAGQTHLLYVGHLCADKGTPQLLEAFASLRVQQPDLCLELVGECLPPFSEAELEALLDRFHLNESVHLAGVLTGRAKAEAFARAHLFIFPTIAPYESFGLVVAEAMSWKLPVVVSRWRGNRDVLTADAGAICFPLSGNLPADIASAIASALKKRDSWSEWGEKNRAIFEQRYRDTPDSDWLAQPLLSLI